jgi:Lon protease-like protein
MGDARVIPLFPLPIVALPGETVPLHIFEERYKAMIADCRAAGGGGTPQPFGISLVEDEAVRDAGCLVRLAGVLREYPDGRLDIVTVGTQRYRTLEVLAGRAYARARVEDLVDDGEVAESALGERAKALFTKFAELATGRPDAGELPAGVPTSFGVAGRLDLEVRFKQELLELTNETVRLQRLAGHLEGAIAELLARQTARHAAGGNGRLRKLN